MMSDDRDTHIIYIANLAMSTSTSNAGNTSDNSIVITHEIEIGLKDMTPRTNYPTSFTEIMADTNLAFFVGPTGIGIALRAQ